MKLLIAACAVAVGLAMPAPVRAQDGQTLADIRQEMAVLYVELQKLKRELSTTGAPNTAFGASSTLERVDVIEQALTQLTSKTEGLENRLNQIVADGTNQLDDMNFRLCELEPGCDIGNLPALKPIGGEAVTAPVATPQPSAPSEGPQLALSEKADFDAAKAVYDEGNFAGAVDKFETFANTYPGGPLTGEAHFWRAESLVQLGQTSAAARAYLTSFSGSPQGGKAPEALYKLGRSLAELGQTNEACVTLEQVTVRFPDAAVAGQAQAERGTLGCS